MPDERALVHEHEAQNVSGYAELDRPTMEARLKAAEDVCVLYGWTGTAEETERSKALLELYIEWHGVSGVSLSVHAHQDLDRRIPALAAKRDATRARTLARLRTEGWRS